MSLQRYRFHWLRPTPKVKKGRGQRKNRRNAQGHAKHKAFCRYAPSFGVTLAS